MTGEIYTQITTIILEEVVILAMIGLPSSSIFPSTSAAGDLRKQVHASPSHLSKTKGFLLNYQKGLSHSLVFLEQLIYFVRNIIRTLLCG